MVMVSMLVAVSAIVFFFLLLLTSVFLFLFWLGSGGYKIFQIDAIVYIYI